MLNSNSPTARNWVFVIPQCPLCPGDPRTWECGVQEWGKASQRALETSDSIASRAAGVQESLLMPGAQAYAHSIQSDLLLT